MSAVLVVTDVLVSPSSVVTECYEDDALDSGRNSLNRSPFRFQRSVRLCGKRIEER